jgi:glycerophosphoryl diester phosphodiesterase
MKRGENTGVIRLWDREQVRERRPLLIAHRGGVIDRNAPENSLRAIELAAAHGYDMVELDVIKPTDDEPMLFHGWTLEPCFGLQNRAEELSSDELGKLVYAATDQNIVSLDAALDLCSTLGLGVMLDIKVDEERLTDGFLDRVSGMLTDYRLTASAMTISINPVVRKALLGRVMLPMSSEQTALSQSVNGAPLDGLFWFDLPEHLPSSLVKPLQDSGALVIPSLNTFRFAPHAHMDLAAEQAKRLVDAGVDGFQLDSVYEEVVLTEINGKGLE